MAGRVRPDSGTLSLQRGLRVGLLEQVPQFKAGATVLSTVLEAGLAAFDLICDGIGELS